MRSPLTAAALLLAACGGIAILDAPGGAGGTGGAGGSAGGAWTGATGGGGGYVYVPCELNGYTICAEEWVGDCPGFNCTGYCTSYTEGAPIGECENEWWLTYDDSEPCQDGAIRTQLDELEPGPLHCRPWEFGVLYQGAGFADWARYADGGLFTGEPLPVGVGCPLPGGAICGGECPACAAGLRCTGLSPLHPFGLCVEPNPDLACQAGAGACPAGYGCATFTVEPAAQPLADALGGCVPAADCVAVSAALPGGASCEAP